MYLCCFIYVWTHTHICLFIYKERGGKVHIIVCRYRNSCRLNCAVGHNYFYIHCILPVFVSIDTLVSVDSIVNCVVAKTTI